MSGAVAVVGRVPPGPTPPCVSALLRRDRPTPRAGSRAVPRERGPRLPAAPTRTPRPERSRGNAVAACPRLRFGRRASGRSLGNAVAACRRLRLGRRAAGRFRGNVRLLCQRLRVHVQHHLIAVAGRPPVESGRQRRLGHRTDGVRLPLRERRLLPVGRLLFHAGRGATPAAASSPRPVAGSAASPPPSDSGARRAWSHAASSARRSADPTSGVNRPRTTTIPSSSTHVRSPRLACWRRSSACSTFRSMRRHARAIRSTCDAVPASAT